MADLVLWKRLTETDFNAMHAEASPHGAGGGARHIALGVRTKAFPIDDFINVPGKTKASIKTLSPKFIERSLDFYSNPHRRGGEWTIRNQYSNRHPAWSTTEGFPSAYNNADPPYVLVFRVNDSFHARFAIAKQLTLGPDTPANMLTDSHGVAPALPAFVSGFGIPTQTLIEAFETQKDAEPAEPFDPSNIDDGRQKVFASIIRRQGQPRFRNALLKAYGGRCAMTDTHTIWVLEAAHITPYRGIKTNALQNGLLLRADVHTLFDLGLVSVEPAANRVRVSSLLKKSDYWTLDQKPLRLPKDKKHFPSVAALEEHFAQFQT